MPKGLCDHFRQMARYNALANRRLLGACCALSDEEFAATRTSFFPSLRQTLNHIYVVDRYYLADVRGEGRRLLQDEVPFARACDLAAAQAASDRELVAFCDALREEDLDRVVPIDRKDGVDYRERVDAVLKHLFLHQLHHRGQAHAMLAGTAVAPPQLDEFFLASDAPQRDVELRALDLDRPINSP